MTTSALTPNSWSNIVGDHYSQPNKNKTISKDAATSTTNTYQIKATKTDIPTSKQKQTQEVFTSSAQNTTPAKSENPFTEVHYSPNKKANLQRKYPNKNSSAQPKPSQVSQNQGGWNPQKISKAAIEAIRFSQKSVNSVFTDENGRDQPLSELEGLMKQGFKKKYALEVVKMPDGNLTSYDNRRLYLAKKILNDNPDYKIWVNVHDANDEAPKGKSNFEQQQFYKNWGWSFGKGQGETKAVNNGSWGQLVALRVAGDFNSAAYIHTPFGYNNPPRVNTQ